MSANVWYTHGRIGPVDSSLGEIDVEENSEQRIKTAITPIITYPPKVQGHSSEELCAVYMHS